MSTNIGLYSTHGWGETYRNLPGSWISIGASSNRPWRAALSTLQTRRDGRSLSRLSAKLFPIANDSDRKRTMCIFALISVARKLDSVARKLDSAAVARKLDGAAL